MVTARDAGGRTKDDESLLSMALHCFVKKVVGCRSTTAYIKQLNPVESKRRSSFSSST